jgi:hypothetical protein
VAFILAEEEITGYPKKATKMKQEQTWANEMFKSKHEENGIYQFNP